MCGLVGAFRADASGFKNIQSFIGEGLFMNALRGTGGTGVGIVPGDFDPWISKSYSSSPVYLEGSEWAYVAQELASARAILGHTRAATLGNRSTANAHPFMFETDKNIVMLTHNGHVNNWTSLTPFKFNHPVDSAHVTHSILHNGAIPTLEKVRGYYVFIWYDDATRTVNIARDGHRDFSYAISEDGKAIYYASEKHMLRSLLERNNIPVRKGFREIEPFLLHTWHLEHKTLENPKKEKYEEKKFQSYPNGSGSGSGEWGSDSGTVDTTGLGERAGGHSPFPGAPLPRIGERIWINGTDAFFERSNAASPPTDDTLGQVVEATSNWDYKSIVTINGVSYGEWHKELAPIRGRIPCIVDFIQKIDDEDAKTGTSSKVTYYKVHLNKAEIQKDLANLKAEEARKRGALSQLPAPAQVSNPARENITQQGKLEQRRETGVGPGVGNLESAITELWAGPGGSLIASEAWEEMAKMGCLTCSNIVRSDLDVGRVIFVPQPMNPEDVDNGEKPDYKIVCPVCARDGEKMRTMLGIEPLEDEENNAKKQVRVL